MIGTMTEAVRYTSPYKPWPWQIEPWRDKSPVMLLTGSAGGGKSRIAAEKVHGFCKKYPNSAAIGLRKAREYASKSVVFALKRAIGDDPTVHYNASDLIFRYDNGSIIFIAGLKDETQRQAIRSINGDGSADIIWGEEANALTEDDHNELMARLRGTAASWRQLIYTTNPDHPRHWIKRRLIDGGEASAYFSKAEDNPANPPDYIDTLAKLTGVLGKRLRDGLWVQAEGVVYEGYRDDVHLIDPFPIPPEWRRYRAIDFGFTNPFVCQWWATDHDGRLYLYREIYMTQRTVKAHSDTIKWAECNVSADEWTEIDDSQRNRLWRDTGERIQATITDHDAEDRATLHENGIATTAAKKDVSRGIQKVEERLAIQGDGKPRVFIMKNALVELDDALDDANKPTSTVQEFPLYVWPKGVDGKPLKEMPVDDNNHGMDTARYMVMHLDAETGWTRRT